MKNIGLYGIGNGISDVLLEVSEEEFAALGYEKGTMLLLSNEEQEALLSKFGNRDLKLVSGGSVANSTVLYAQLGGKAGFSCRLADDNYGLHYKSEFEALGIELPNAFHVGGQSGTSAILITPDAERTMRTCLGASAAFGPDEIEEDLIRRAEWIFIEGYLFSSPDGQNAVTKAIEVASQNQTKIAVTLSDVWVINTFRDTVEKALESAELVFANESESIALTEASSLNAALETFHERFPQTVVTLGGEGCYVKSDGFTGKVSATEVSPVDLTGAGDAFAGGYLYGISNGLAGDAAAKCANFLAAQVIQRVGARLHGDAKALWQQAA